jgi:hypothetical protein
MRSNNATRNTQNAARNTQRGTQQHKKFATQTQAPFPSPMLSVMCVREKQQNSNVKKL